MRNRLGDFQPDCLQAGFAAMEAGAQRAVAEQMVRQELMESVPSLEEWCASTAQMGLFGAGK